MYIVTKDNFYIVHAVHPLSVMRPMCYIEAAKNTKPTQNVLDFFERS